MHHRGSRPPKSTRLERIASSPSVDPRPLQEHHMDRARSNPFPPDRERSRRAPSTPSSTAWPSRSCPRLARTVDVPCEGRWSSPTGPGRLVGRRDRTARRRHQWIALRCRRPGRRLELALPKSSSLNRSEEHRRRTNGADAGRRFVCCSSSSRSAVPFRSGAPTTRCRGIPFSPLHPGRLFADLSATQMLAKSLGLAATILLGSARPACGGGVDDRGRGQNCRGHRSPRLARYEHLEILDVASLPLDGEPDCPCCRRSCSARAPGFSRHSSTGSASRPSCVP